MPGEHLSPEEEYELYADPENQTPRGPLGAGRHVSLR
jgi:hypothetical protein